MFQLQSTIGTHTTHVNLRLDRILTSKSLFNKREVIAGVPTVFPGGGWAAGKPRREPVLTPTGVASFSAWPPRPHSLWPHGENQRSLSQPLCAKNSARCFTYVISWTLYNRSAFLFPFQKLSKEVWRFTCPSPIVNVLVPQGSHKKPLQTWWPRAIKCSLSQFWRLKV